MRPWTALALAVPLLLAACGARPAPSAPKPPATVPAPAPAPSAAPATPTVTDLGSVLPDELSGEAAATLGDTVYVVGGDGPKGFSDAILAWRPAQRSATVAGRLPIGLHDLGAMFVGDSLYVFGGGQSDSVNTIYRWRPGDAKATLVGRLPAPLSDLTAAGGYVFGGWTGSRWNDAVYAYAGGALRQVARLPVGLRYTAAARVDGRILLFGGKTPGGTSAAIYRFDPGSGRVERAGSLPAPLAYGMAAPYRDGALVFGDADRVLRYGPGGVTAVARLPRKATYGAAVALGDAVYVFAGREAYAVR